MADVPNIPAGSGPRPKVAPVQEVRLAIVMYGGSSLAIYINGVAQELLNLVRATAPADREGESPALLAEGELRGTQVVYRRLGQMVAGGRPLAEIDPAEDITTRFVVDIISGSSAGGINGVFLAKALANELSLDQLKALWVKEGDIGLLINDREAYGDLPGIDANATLPPRSLLSGRRMYWKLLRAIDDMAPPDPLPLLDREAPPTPGAPSRLVEQLDLYVTATDIGGLVLPIKLTDATIFEPRHRNVFHFVYAAAEAGGGDKPRNDLDASKNPFLAFAARCSSSLPFVFEPMTLGDVDPVVASFSRYAGDVNALSQSKAWEPFYKDYVRAPAAPPAGPARRAPDTGNDFAKRPFGDGGSLDNAPFTYATDALVLRRADLPVVRKLFYVEPDPNVYDPGGPAVEPPDAVENVMKQVVALPRKETIRGDLEDIVRRNRQIERLEGILDPLDDDLDLAFLAHPPAPLKLEALRAMYLDELMHIYGVGYGSYQRLRVEQVTDDLAALFVRLGGLKDDSDYTVAVRELVVAWRDLSHAHYAAPASLSKKSFSGFLIDLDITFALRRLARIQQSTNLLFEPEARSRILRRQDVAPGVAEAGDGFLAALKEFRTELADTYARLRAAGRSARRPDEGNSIYGQLEAQKLTTSLAPLLGELLDGGSGSSDRAEAIVADQAQAVAAVIQALVEVLSGALREAEEGVMRSLDTFGRRGPAADAAARHLRDRYRRFVFYDMLAVPATYGTDAGETRRVDVYRVSPKDAKGLIDVSGGRKKVAGAEYGHFGAFFDRLWRENDIMWGRLDAAERILDAMVPQGPNRLEAVKALREQAYAAIVEDELQPAQRAKLTELAADLLATLPPGSANTAAIRARVEATLGTVLDDRAAAVLAACAAPEQLVDYLRNQFSLDTRLHGGPLLEVMGRATHVVGRVLDGVARNRKVPLAQAPAAWVARMTGLMATMIEAAIPGRLKHVLVKHWTAIVAILGLVLIVMGSLTDRFRPTVGLGWTLLLGTIALRIVLSMIGDTIRGGRIGALALKALIGGGVAGVLMLAVHGADDLLRRSIRPPPELPFMGSIAAQPWVVAVLALLTVAAALILGAQARPLKRPGLRSPVVQFELAGTADRSNAILWAWNAAARTTARTGILLDFAFIAMYTVVLYALNVWAVGVWVASSPVAAWLAAVLAVGTLVAGLCDVVENLLLLRLLRRAPSKDSVPRLVATLARTKFVLIGLAVLSTVVATLRWGLWWLSSR